ncbi:MAG TPA: hypothetical protein VGI99_00985 [Gemmataceae bacterium]|jgi:WD40 repeat protein
MGRSLIILVIALALSAPLRAEEFLVPSARTGNSELFLIDPAKGDAKNATNTDKAEEFHPAWSRDGKRIAFTCKSREHDFEVYTADADGSHRQRVTTAAAPSQCFTPAWSADGKQLVYMRLFQGGKCEVRVVNADGSGDRLLAADAIGPTWSPDGSGIAFVRKFKDKPNSLCVVRSDGSDERVLIEEVGRDGAVFLAWNPDGKFIALSTLTSYGWQIALVPAAGGPVQQLTHLPGYNINPVWIAADRLLFTHMQPDGRNGVYASIKTDGTRLAIHALTKVEKAYPNGRPAFYVASPINKAEQNEVHAVKRAAFVEPATVKASSVKAVPAAMMPPALPGTVNAAVWSADGTRLAFAIASGYGLIGEFDGKTMRLVDAFRGHEGSVDAIGFSPNGKFLHTAGADKSVRIWDIAQKGSTSIETDQGAAVDSLAVSSNGKLLATGGHDGKLKLRDAATAKPLREIEVCDSRRGAVHALAFSKDDRMLFAGCAKWSMPVLGGIVAAFDADSGEELWRTKGTLGGVFALALSPDGSKLAGACLDTFVRIWDAKSGKELACWKGHGDRVTGVAWGLGGQVLVTASFDHTVRIWDAARGTIVQTLAAHSTPAMRVAATPDGKFVASTSQAGDICIWRLTSE